MKKILALCLSLILLTTCTPTVFAYEDSFAGFGEMEIIAHVYSSYSISIPATIDLTAGMMGEVTILDANLEEGYKVDVYATNFNENGAITLTNTANSFLTIECRLYNLALSQFASPEVPLVTFNSFEFDGNNTATKNFDIQFAPVGSAGIYSGTMTYSFQCSPCE